MERKKKQKENYPVKKNSVRIWPGVLVITVFACALFLLVNYLGFKAGLITMPDFLRPIIAVQQDEEDQNRDNVLSQSLQPGLTSAETQYTYYTPEQDDPVKLLQSLRITDSFHQRMRFTTMGDAGNSNRVVNLYAVGTKWRIEQENTLCISDGESIWRVNANEKASCSEVGTFTWNNHLGIPTLGELQAYGKENPDKVLFREADRIVFVEYHPGENSHVQCYIAVDTGLVTEMQVFVNNEQVLSMYTERASVSPDICTDAGMFTWTDTKGNG